RTAGSRTAGREVPEWQYRPPAIATFTLKPKLKRRSNRRPARVNIFPRYASKRARRAVRASVSSAARRPIAPGGRCMSSNSNWLAEARKAAKKHPRNGQVKVSPLPGAAAASGKNAAPGPAGRDQNRTMILVRKARKARRSGGAAAPDIPRREAKNPSVPAENRECSCALSAAA